MRRSGQQPNTRILLVSPRPQCVESDAIASGVFGGIHGAVCDGEQGLDGSGLIGWFVDSGAHATVERELRIAHSDLQIGNRSMEAVQSLFDRLARNLGEYEQELLTAIAAGMVVSADGRADCGGEAAQRLIAGQMAVAVIDALEMIQIKHRDGDGQIFAPGALHLLHQGLQNGGAVEQSGEPVVSGLDVQPLAARLQFSCALGNQRRQMPASGTQLSAIGLNGDHYQKQCGQDA